MELLTLKPLAFGLLCGFRFLFLQVVFPLLADAIPAFLDLPVYFAEEIRRRLLFHARSVRQSGCVQACGKKFKLQRYGFL